MTRTLSVSLIALLSVTVSLTGCRKYTEETSQIQEFYQIVRSELAKGGDGSRSGEYLMGLPASEQLEMARVIALDPDIRISFLGADLLMKTGHEDEAVPALAAIVARGEDLTRIGYYWAHSDDETLAVRMYIKISRDLLARLVNYGVEERKYVEQFLSDGGYVDAIKVFSPAAVEHRLKEIEAKLRTQSATTPNPTGMADDE